jgi:hypothetical protein
MEAKTIKKQLKQCPQCAKRFKGIALKVYCSEYCADQAYWNRRKAREGKVSNKTENQTSGFDYLRLVGWLKMQMNETAIEYWISELEKNENKSTRLHAQGLAFHAVLKAIQKEEFWK